MIVNDLHQIEKKKFKVIIIGSGLAGISTALKLEKNGIEVLIIESGGMEFQSDSFKFLNVDLSVIDFNHSTNSFSRHISSVISIDFQPIYYIYIYIL